MNIARSLSKTAELLIRPPVRSNGMSSVFYDFEYPAVLKVRRRPCGPCGVCLSDRRPLGNRGKSTVAGTGRLDVRKVGLTQVRGDVIRST